LQDDMSVVALLLPSVAMVLAGVVFGRLVPTRALSRGLFYVGLPIVVLRALFDTKPGLFDLMVVGGGALFVMLLTGGVAFATARWLALPERGLCLSVAFMNSGNLAIPIATAAFGVQGLSQSVLYCLVASVVQHSAGVWLASRGRADGTSFLRLPTPYIAALGFALIGAGVELPPLLSDGLDLLSRAFLPLMLVCLGAELRAVGARPSRVALLASGLRLGGGFTAAWLFVQLFGLDGVARHVILVSSSMPTAVWSVLIARRYDADAEVVTATLVTSTLVAIPFLAWSCIVGMGAIVLDGAHIPRGSIVAAGALVTPGAKFPSG
jgi:predicted permease